MRKLAKWFFILFLLYILANGLATYCYISNEYTNTVVVE